MDSIFKKLMFTLAALCLTLAFATSMVFAQTLREGTAYVEGRGGVYGTTNQNVDLIATYGGAFGYYVFNNVALEAEGLGYYVGQQKKTVGGYSDSVKDAPTNGAGVNVIAKWHFVATPQASAYVGAGGGGLWTQDKVAYNGEKNNWTGLTELGMTFNLAKTLDLRAAGRYQHIGSFSNTGVDALGGNVGFKFSF